MARKGALLLMEEYLGICLRPHHIACIRHFIGDGYDSGFIANMKAIIGRLDSEQRIKIVFGADSLCAACPHNQNDVCAEENRVRLIDEKCASILGVTDGDIVNYFDIFRSMERYMEQNDALKRLCHDCEWLDLCMEVHNRLKHIER